MSSEVKRGEIYWVDWAPARGSEQKGKRPALVIQNDIGNRLSSTIIVATCSTKFTKAYPFQVFVEAQDSGLTDDCIIDLAQIITIDKSRLLKKCGKLSKDKMYEVNKALEISLGL